MTAEEGTVHVAVLGCGAIGRLYAAQLARVPVRPYP
jgi:ketopantoate reductase